MSGPSRPFDPRTHAARRDIADAGLAGMLFAPHYAMPHVARCAAGFATLHAEPSAGSVAVSQIKRGEAFAAVEISGGWAWGYGLHDRYVGYLPAELLGDAAAEPTHRVAVPTALVFAAPSIKAPVVAEWPIGALVSGEADGGFVATGSGFVHARHVVPLADRADDPVAVAERLIGLPYRWGGRGGGGIDCSGLVQLALAFAGIEAPRDSDQQRGSLGRELGADEPLRRGDILFFPGHVGLMADGARLLHANAHWMATVVEPLADVIARLEAAGTPAPLLARRRIEA